MRISLHQSSQLGLHWVGFLARCTSIRHNLAPRSPDNSVWATGPPWAYLPALWPAPASIVGLSEGIALSALACRDHSCRLHGRVASSCTFRRGRTPRTKYHFLSRMANPSRLLGSHSMECQSTCTAVLFLLPSRHSNRLISHFHLFTGKHSHSWDLDGECFSCAMLSKLCTFQWIFSRWSPLRSFVKLSNTSQSSDTNRHRPNSPWQCTNMTLSLQKKLLCNRRYLDDCTQSKEIVNN